MRKRKHPAGFTQRKKGQKSGLRKSTQIYALVGWLLLVGPYRMRCDSTEMERVTEE